MGNTTCADRCEGVVEATVPEGSVPMESSWQEELCSLESTTTFHMPMRAKAKEPFENFTTIESPGQLKVPLLTAIKRAPDQYVPVVDVATSEERPKRSVTVTLRPHGRLGANFVDRPEGGLVVSTLEATGALAGASGEGGFVVLTGDVVVAVDGAPCTTSELVAKAEIASRTGIPMDFSIHPRPPSFIVQLRRKGPDGNRFGMRAVIDDDTDRVVVLAVFKRGLVPEWNAAHALHRICPGDSITGVNNARTASDMWEVLQESREGSLLTLHLDIPPRETIALLR